MAQKSTETSMQLNPVAQSYHQAATAEERLLEEGEFKTMISDRAPSVYRDLYTRTFFICRQITR